jgi:subtilisin family serine protease
MKVTVNKYLNVRVGKPSVNAPCYQYLAPGSELEVDGQSYPGDTYKDINIWYKDAADNYYWSGGVQNNFIKNQSFDYWFDLLEMIDIQKIEGGENANILILDSGINDFLPAFNTALVQPASNFAPNSNSTLSKDGDCHGTHCSGLIAARLTEYKVGVATKSKIYCGKITENGELDDSGTMKSALREFLKGNYDFDVISISQTTIADDHELQTLIQNHVDKKRIVIAAIGNDNQLSNSNKKRYPGFYDNCISVGACDKNNQLSAYTCYPSKVNIFCYGTNILSYKKDPFPQTLTGTSQSTAIVAGICALIISFLKKQRIDYDQTSVRNLLRKYSTSLEGYPNFPLIQPKLIFNKLLTFTQNENKSLQSLIDADVSIS